MREERARAITSFIGDAVIPRKHRRRIARYVEVADLKWSAHTMFGVLVYVIAFLSFVLASFFVMIGPLTDASFVLRFLFFFPFFIAFFLILLIFGRIAVKYYIDARVFAKVRVMEEVFPEFLSEVSLNLKSGQGMEKALSLAAKQDYGTLSDEMLRVAARMELGFDLQSGIESFVESYPSDLMKDTFELILISLRRGGQTPRLIDRLVLNMKTRRNLRDKIVASVANYRIFLATVTVLIAPAMMALSYHVISLIRSITTEVMQVTQQATLPISVAAVRFEDTHFIVFSMLTLFAISTFSSLIVTYIRNGNIKGGSKQLMFYVLSSLAAYGFFMVVFAQFFVLFQN